MRLWDARQESKCKGVQGVRVAKPGIDANVIAWNRLVPYLMAVGLDDGTSQVLDLRMLSALTSPKAKSYAMSTPVAQFSWHRGPITSITWHPQEESVLAMTGADDQLTIWDLSLERDPEAMDGPLADLESQLPPQLLCIHQGQSDMKEVHFHPQLRHVAVSTALTGFHIFRSISLLSQ